MCGTLGLKSRESQDGAGALTDAQSGAHPGLSLVAGTATPQPCSSCPLGARGGGVFTLLSLSIQYLLCPCLPATVHSLAAYPSPNRTAYAVTPVPRVPDFSYPAFAFL